MNQTGSSVSSSVSSRTKKHAIDSKKPPRFSIIIPLYNKKEYIKACLTGIQNQTEHSWECIIINDGSTDGSERVARAFSEKDSRFKLFSQDNLGPSVARNQGIKKAKGKLLHFMDADDFYPDDTTLSSIYGVYKKYKPKAVAGNIGILASGSDAVNFELDVNSNVEKNQTFDELQNDYFFTRFFFDRKFIVENNIQFPEYTRVGEDPVFLVTALSLMDKFLITNIPVYIYNETGNGNSVISNYDNEKTIGYINSQTAILKICRQHNYSRLAKTIFDRIDVEMIDVYIKKSKTSTSVAAVLDNLLSLMPPELYYERIVKIRKNDYRVHQLEQQLSSPAGPQPGIKHAAKNLMGAVKKRLRTQFRRSQNE